MHYDEAASMTDTLPDLAAEIIAGDAITIIDIARQMRTAPSTIYRWMLRGLPDGRGERIRLHAIRRGKVWLTSRAALQRFLGALPQSAPTPTAPPVRTPTKRERDTTRAKKALAEQYGI
jgi:hypothetical protein